MNCFHMMFIGILMGGFKVAKGAFIVSYSIMNSFDMFFKMYFKWGFVRAVFTSMVPIFLVDNLIVQKVLLGTY